MAAPGMPQYLRASLPQGLALPGSLWQARHRFLTWVAATQAFALPFFAVVRGVDPTLGLLEGGAIALLALAGNARALPRRAQAACTSLGLLVASTAFVHANGGATAAHAHYFVTLALVALYQDWRPFIAALAYIPLANGLLAALGPGLAYPAGVPAATWVLTESVLVTALAVVLLAFWSGAEHVRARSDLLLTSAGEGVLGLDSSGTITFANPAAHALFERDPGDGLVGRGIRELMAGTAFSLAPTGATPGAGSLATRGGRWVPVEWTLTPTMRAGVGIGSVMVLRDVSARRDLERRLESRNRQQALVAGLGPAALAQPRERFLAQVAAVVAEGLDADACQVLGRRDADGGLDLLAAHGLGASLGASARRPPHPDPIERALRGAEPVAVDALDPRDAAAALDGRRPASAIAMGLRGRSGPAGVLVAYAMQPRAFTRDDIHFVQSVASLAAAALLRHQDESELLQHRSNLEGLVARRTAELTQANRELEAFSYTVSHDLRSPLRALGGFSRILRRRHDGDLPEDSKGLLRLIDEGAVRMGALIESVLLLTRISRARLAHEPIDLSALARSILDEQQARQPERRVAITIEPGLRARGDPGLVRLALTNLLHNAWKFTSRTPDARITLRRAGADGPDAEAFVVEDNGAGFDMALAADLFQPFSRLHEPTEFEGTGVGLATVDRVVQRHGGRIWAQAEPGQGARFTFTLRPHGESVALAGLDALADDGPVRIVPRRALAPEMA